MKTRDEITAARRKRRRKYQLRRFMTLVVSLMLLTGVILLINSIQLYTFRDIGDYFKTAFSGGDGYPSMLVSTKPLKVTALKNAAAVLTDSELIIKGNKGGELLRAAHNYSNPSMQASGSRVLVYDSGNRGFSVYNRTSGLFYSESEYPIISADIAADGTVAVLTRGDRSVSQLLILSGKNYATLLTWYGAKGFPMNCGIIDNGREVYVASLIAVMGGIDTIFTTIDTVKLTQRSETVIPGTFMRAYESSEGYVVITDKGSYLYDRELKLKNKYEFSRIPVLRVSGEGGNLAIAFGDNQQPDINHIIVLSAALEEILRIDSAGAVDDLCMAADRFYQLSSGIIHEIKFDGEYTARYETQLKAYKVFLFGNKVSVLLSDRIDRPEPYGITD